MKIELLQLLTPIYGFPEVAKAEQTLLDTKSQLSKWEDEVEKLKRRREELAELASSAEAAQNLQWFLASERQLQYTGLASAEAKVATCFRKIEELEAFLERAAQAHEILGWR